MLSNHDEYIASAAEELRPLLIQLRSELRAALPEAEEVIKYNMPGFQMGNSIIAGYAAFSKQCGLYVAKSAIEALTDDISATGLKATKTGITFSPSKPIPPDLIRKLALASKEDQAA
ncbi:MAG TPA: DUF1801 domain-containing protein [Fimbriimonas sp.]|nr:DUF1801 domain-containing protein [Fimbriimonas sp.]